MRVGDDHVEAQTNGMFGADEEVEGHDVNENVGSEDQGHEGNDAPATA